jgi:UDP-N-acetylglucosamine:LPS N-acetylglucosamine transferase
MSTPRPGSRRRRLDVLLVSSSGGHLIQLHLLRSAWVDLDRAWVCHDKDDARSLLRGETTYFAYWPTTRNVVNLVRNLVLAWRLIGRLRPVTIVTAGAGVAVPFAWVGRLRGSKVVYVESLTRIREPSLSLRLIAPVADRIYAQWPELTAAVPSARYAGSVLEAP